MWLLAVALVGLVVPNGVFLYWLFAEFDGLQSALHNHLALAFMLDAAITLVILAVYFAHRPIGPIRWPWFVVLSLLGGFAFSLPFYWWLNTRQARSA